MVSRKFGAARALVVLDWLAPKEPRSCPWALPAMCRYRIQKQLDPEGSRCRVSGLACQAAAACRVRRPPGPTQMTCLSSTAPAVVQLHAESAGPGGLTGGDPGAALGVAWEAASVTSARNRADRHQRAGCYRRGVETVEKRIRVG